MKTYIIIFAILCMASCHPYRSTLLKTTQHSQQQFHQRQLYQWDDSLSRWWYFYTDSPFVYHPDSMLIAHSGYLWFNEHRFRSSLQQLEQDSTRYESNTYTQKQKEATGKPMGYLGLVLGLMSIVVVAGLYSKVSKK